MNRKRILVVDDEESINRLLKLNLEKTGAYVVQTEAHGAQALDTARKFKPDLVLLDVMIPDLDGGDIASQMLEDAELKHVPIVFLTAAVQREEISVRDGTIGGFPYIAKPLNVEGVIRAIEKHLSAQPQPV